MTSEMHTTQPELTYQQYLAGIMGLNQGQAEVAATIPAQMPAPEQADPSITPIEQERLHNLERGRQAGLSLAKLFARNDPMHWATKAACRGAAPGVFYPLSESNKMTKSEVEAAKKICAQCTVREDCLDYALSHNEVGVWGGTSERERKHLKLRSAVLR